MTTTTMTTTGNRYEFTVRARKAFRLYAVLVTGIDGTPGFPLTATNLHLICTDEVLAPFRRSYERLAKVHQASEVTWAMVEGLLTEHYLTPASNIVDLCFYL